MEKYLILLTVLSFCKGCVGSFVYYSRQNSTSCVVGFGGLMNIICTIGLPILVVLSITLLQIVWWAPIVAVISGWVEAKIIGIIPFVNMLMWMLSYIGLPISIVWTVIEMIKLYNL